MFALAACGGGSLTPVSLSGTVSGLNAAGLRLTGTADTLDIGSGATSFNFGAVLYEGEGYSVAIQSQPAGETCSVANGSGVAGLANIANVVVTCADQAFQLGGSVSGLTASGLQLANGSSTVTVAPGATSFVLPAAVANGSSYNVSVRAQPSGEACTVMNGTGTMGAADITSVAVSCTDQPFTLGGTITGLSSSGLVLANGSSSTLAVSANATSFTLPSPVDYASTYSVTVQTQPAGLTCSFSSGGGLGAASGTMPAGNVTTLALVCSPQSYQLGGSVSGLTSGTLVLADGSDMATVTANGSFQLSEPVAYGTAYAITVQTQPAGLTCSVTSGVGAMPAAAVTSVTVTCAATAYTVGGTISGLGSNTGLVLLDNGADATAIAANATRFSMNTGLASGSTYAITVHASPLGLACSVSNATGTVAYADITDVAATCAAPTETVLHSFAGGAADGRNPLGSLIQASNGKFYGLTFGGLGTLFEYDPSTGIETLLHAFAGGDGANPHDSLVQGADGKLYGTVQGGGAYGSGALFQYDPSAGTETLVYSFGTAANDGQNPQGTLTQATDGNFYGLTPGGGINGDGALFEYDPSTGTEAVLWSFGAPGDGQTPRYGSLVQGTDGSLYGVTSQGGANGDGTVFKYDLSTRTETILYSFGATAGDGTTPFGGLILGSDGKFYGLTSAGGANGAGTLFRYDPSTGTEMVLWSFGGSGDGAGPQGSLLQASDGNFYGLTASGGAHGDGTVFEYSPTVQQEAVLWSFGSTGDGQQPDGSLIQASDGNFYGLTGNGGANGYGAIFRIN